MTEEDRKTFYSCEHDPSHCHVVHLKLMSKLNPAYRTFASWPCEKYSDVPLSENTTSLL